MNIIWLQSLACNQLFIYLFLLDFRIGNHQFLDIKNNWFENSIVAKRIPCELSLSILAIVYVS